MENNTILVTGKNIDPEYNRSLIVLNGLRELGFKVEEYSFSKFDKDAAKAVEEKSRKAYFTYVPCMGHKSVKFVKKHSCCEVVFDPLISRYMTFIGDYKKYGKYSYEALRSRYRDRNSLKKADYVIFDTLAHRKYFFKNYKIAPEKTGIVYVGANTCDFKKETPAIKKEHQKFRVGFVGHFIPLQGVLTILEAARLLENESDVEFYFIGKGFEFQQAVQYVEKHQLKQVVFKGLVAYNELDSYINSFDLCLGIFGNTFKASVVIPNKIFNYSTCARPVLTMESEAINEVFTHKEDIFLCKPEAGEIASAILKLKKDPALRNKLGDAIYKKATEEFSEKKIASSLLEQYKLHLLTRK